MTAPVATAPAAKITPASEIKEKTPPPPVATFAEGIIVAIGSLLAATFSFYNGVRAHLVIGICAPTVTLYLLGVVFAALALIVIISTR